MRVPAESEAFWLSCPRRRSPASASSPVARLCAASARFASGCSHRVEVRDDSDASEKLESEPASVNEIAEHTFLNCADAGFAKDTKHDTT
jgi:hypothetical protein